MILSNFQLNHRHLKESSYIVIALISFGSFPAISEFQCEFLLNSADNDEINGYIIQNLVGQELPAGQDLGTYLFGLMPIKNSSNDDCSRCIAILLANGKAKESKMPSDSLISTLVGGFLAILGGILTAIWNDRNESRKTKFEWGKFLFEKYEKNYFDFIKSISEIYNADDIDANYKILISSAFIPEYLKVKI